MFNGYYAFAGNELANAGRTAAYVRNLIPSFPLRGNQTEFDTLATALGEGEYVSPAEDDAPWVSPDDTSTNDFYGLWPLDVSGIGDSTLEAPITQGILNGGYAGAGRDATRSMRFHGMLVAANELALEAGLTWLRALLATTSCGSHSSFCGTSELNYFLSKPPADSSAAALQPYERRYHDVSCTNGVSIIRRVRTSCGVGLEVDFVITAGNPYAYSNPVDATGSLVPAAAPYSDYVMNLNATGPRADTAGGAVNYIENKCPNPSAEAGLAGGYIAVPGTTGVAAVTNPVTPTAYGTKVARVTWSTASTAAGGGMYIDVPVTALSVMSFQVNHVKPSITNRLKLRIEWRTNVATISNSDGPEFVAAAGTVSNPKLENLTAPATATVARVTVLSVAGVSYANWSIASYLELDAVMANIGEVAALYFDAANVTAWGADYTGLWLGTVGLSTSRLLPLSIPYGWYGISTPPVGGLVAVGTGALAWLMRTTEQVHDAGVSSHRIQWWKAPTDDADVVLNGDDFLNALVLPPTVDNVGAAPVNPIYAYVGSIWARPSKAQRLKIRFRWFDDAGVYLGFTDGAAAAYAGATWSRVTGSATAPAGAIYALINLVSTAGIGYTRWAGGDFIDADEKMVTFGTTVYDYFDGSSPDNAMWDYAWYVGVLFNHPEVWFGSASASPTLRTPVAAASITELIDPDLPTLPTPPAPPVIPNDAVTPQFDYLRYYLPIAKANVPEWAAGVPTIDLSTLAEDARQVRIRFYPNPGGLDPEFVDPDSYCGEFILSYLPANATLTIDGVDELAYVVFAGSTAQIVADQLLYGTAGAPVDWPELSCGLASLMTVDIPPSNSAGTAPASITNLHIELAVTRKE